MRVTPLEDLANSRGKAGQSQPDCTTDGRIPIAILVVPMPLGARPLLNHGPGCSTTYQTPWGVCGLIRIRENTRVAPAIREQWLPGGDQAGVGRSCGNLESDSLFLAQPLLSE